MAATVRWLEQNGYDAVTPPPLPIHTATAAPLQGPTLSSPSSLARDCVSPTLARLLLWWLLAGRLLLGRAGL
jgi:hypothetical protein